VTASVADLFAANVDFLRMEPKPFCFHKAQAANNHIKQDDACFFAHYPIGITYDQLAAVLTGVIHDLFTGKENAISDYS
jgi:hypothetical protein